MARVNLNLNTRILTRRGGMIDRYVERKADQVEARAKTLAPTRTGRLAASIHVERQPSPASYRVVAATGYARFVEFGVRQPRPRRFLTDALKVV